MRKYQSFSVFMVSFLISAAVLLIPTVVAAFVLGSPTITPSEQDYSTSYYPTKTEDINLLLGCQNSTKAVSTTMLVKFSPIDKKITLAVIPTETMVEYGGRFDSLAGLWKKQGGEKTAFALSTALGVPVDRYALVDTNGFITISDTVGRIEFDVKEPVELEGGGIAVNTGVQPLDGRKISALLSYRGYPLGEPQRLGLVQELSLAAINQRLPSMTMPSIETLFNTAINLCDTNITYSDYHFRKGGIHYLTNQSDVAQAVLVEGSYNQAGNTFLPSPQSLERIKTAFGIAEK